MSSVKYDAIIIGAGVIGPTIATAFARQGRKVLIVERDWSKPDRIVGVDATGWYQGIKRVGDDQSY